MLLLFIAVLQICAGVLAAHPCERECISRVRGDTTPPMTCHFHFKLEAYQVLSKACYNCTQGNLADCMRPDCVPADGVARPIVTVNRMLPGPAIRVCLGDRVVVDVENTLSAETTSLHWHGHHQRGSPHMDGVPHVTQCPIPPGTSFRYVFLADNAGTHFWHSHSGLQRADGVTGALIIKRGLEDPHRVLYDTDVHELHLTDWLHGPANSKFVGHHHGDGNNKPRSILINGRGWFGNGTFMSNFTVPIMPLTTFSLQSGLRHRFRLINSGFLNCPLEMSIDNHTLLVIASDGSDLRPVEVDSLVSYAGERFDFVVLANQPVGRYWLRVRGLMDCDERFNAVHQVAVVTYEGSSADDEPSMDSLGYAQAARGGKQLNSLNVGSNNHDENTLTMADVSSLKPGDLNLLASAPDHTFFVGYDFYKKDNPVFHKPGLYGFHQVVHNTERLLTPQLNHISLQLPSTPMILQDESSLAAMMCNQSSLARDGRNCGAEFCRCLHRIRVEIGDIVDLVLVDEGVAFNANHPFHLHGHAFHVIAMQRVGENTTIAEVRTILDKRQVLPSMHAPLKDTITVPDGGFTMVRFRASNPGVWLFHCHIGFHVEVGMGLVLQVGDWSSFVKTPQGFPTCGDWLPSITDTQLSLLPASGSSSKGDSTADQLIYYLLHNISQRLQPPVVVVQQTWPEWWAQQRLPPSASGAATRSTFLFLSSVLAVSLVIFA